MGFEGCVNAAAADAECAKMQQTGGAALFLADSGGRCYCKPRDFAKLKDCKASCQHCALICQ
eukprot:gene16020-5866_t